MSKGGRLGDGDIAAVRRAADIVAVIGDVVQLTRSGSAFKGLCIFHDEKTPSMQVTSSSEGGHFYCFGCNQNGDVIDFVQQVDGLTFREAVETLAERFNVTLHPVESPSERTERSPRARIIEANDAAAAWFADRLLNDDEATPARDLLTSRGFDVAESITRFGCGYAPRRPTALVRHLRQQKFTPDEIIAAGLANSTQSETLLSRFTGRLTWTIRSPLGKAIGFGARKLHDDDPIPGKFINTADTTVYHKSDVLYGLDLARREVVKSRRAVVVEGYTDVMAMHLAEVPLAVATCGTSFTTEHLAVLRRLVGVDGEIVFGFDDDQAGRKAALKVYDLAQTQLRRLSALPRSGGLDPDEMRQQHGDAALAALVDQRRPLIETALLNTIGMYPLDTPEERRVALDAVLPLLERARDPLLRSEYVQLVARRLRYDPMVVAAQVKAPLPLDPATRNVLASPAQTAETLERDAVHVLVHSHALAVERLDEVAALLGGDKARSVAALLATALADTEGDPSRPWPLRVMEHADDDTRALVGKLVGMPLRVAEDRLDNHLTEIVSRLRSRVTTARRAALQAALAEAEDDDTRARLLADLLALGAA